MIEASRSYEARSYATRRSHLADVLPMSRDLRRVRAALNPTHATESRASAWVACLIIAIIFCIGVAL